MNFSFRDFLFGELTGNCPDEKPLCDNDRQKLRRPIRSQRICRQTTNLKELSLVAFRNRTSCPV